MVRFCLDTNAVIALIRNDAIIVSKTEKERLFVPTTVPGELYFGAERSLRVNENLARLNNFALRTVILPIGSDIAWEYGKVHSELLAKGRPIPPNDMWIAATARFHRMTLLTRDTHFDHVDRLQLEDW